MQITTKRPTSFLEEETNPDVQEIKSTKSEQQEIKSIIPKKKVVVPNFTTQIETLKTKGNAICALAYQSQCGLRQFLHCTWERDIAVCINK